MQRKLLVRLVNAAVSIKFYCREKRLMQRVPVPVP